ncbi:MAG: transposase, partial [Deltaproteobacteria bacterium]|nr:transposase [Deltaproteobacteria bacterium]
IFAYRCPKCGKIHHAYAPPEIMDKSLLDDALLVDLLVYKTMNTILVRKLQAIYSDLLGVNISTGGLVDLSKAVGSMLRPICLEAPHSVKHQPLFYIDETSFRIMKKRMYTWVFESPDLMVFKNGTRSRFILDSVLGEWYVGILVSDAYGACVGFVKDAPGATGMLCWARFRRDLKLCMDHGGKAARDFGGSLNIIMDDTFAAFNDYKVLEDKNSPEALELYVKLRKIQKILPRRIKVIITLVRNPVLIRDCFQYLAAGVIVYF